LASVLEGEAGPRREVVALNAGAALEVAGLSPDLKSGVDRARDVLVSGEAARVLKRYTESSQRSAS